MDINKKYQGGNDKIMRGIKIYDDAETVEEQQRGITMVENGLSEIKLVYQYGPPYMKNIVGSKITTFQERLDQMKENKGRIAQAAPVGGGGGGKKGDNEKDEHNAQILEAIVQEKPNVKWEDIGGLEGAKTALKDAVIMPIKFPNFFNDVVKPWKGILLYGPPGTGKTFLAKACATECDSTFFSISSSDLISKFVGESEKMIKALFTEARKCEAAIIFIDEIDSLCSSRSENENESSRRVKTEFLVQMDGVGHEGGRLLVLGATNIPWDIDQAVRRRFEKRIYIPLPDYDARRYLLERKIDGVPCTCTPHDFDEITKRIDGYSGSDIEVLVKDAAMEPLRFAQVTDRFERQYSGKFMPVAKNTPLGGSVIQSSIYDLPENSLELQPVTKADFIAVLSKSKASVGANDLEEFINWTSEFGEEGC